MIATSARSGERLWSISVPGTQTPQVIGETVFVVDTQGQLLALTRREGKTQWTAKLPGGGQHGDAQVVANVIVDAAKSDQPKRRYLVGQDAELLGGLHKQMSDEDFEKAMRTTLDVWD